MTVAWKHPGGKFRRLGPSSCSETELLAIIIGQGSHNRSAEAVAQDVIDRYGTLLDIMGQPLKDLMKIRGLKEVKVTQLAAVFEITRRIVKHLEQA